MAGYLVAERMGARFPLPCREGTACGAGRGGFLAFGTIRVTIDGAAWGWSPPYAATRERPDVHYRAFTGLAKVG